MSTPRDSKFRLPSKPTVILVTPEMAGDWLDYRNTPLKNRSISRGVVGKYAEAMRRKDWKLIADPLSFDTEGWLLNGQHRLSAVALSGRAQEFWVFPDEPRDTFDAYDTGRKRSAAQLLHVPNRNVLASATRFLAAVDGIAPPRGEGHAFAELTNQQVLALVRHYSPDLDQAAREAMNVKNKARIPPSPHAAVLYQALNSEHAELVQDWSDSLRTGANLDERDSRLRLRSVFLANAGVRAAALRSPSMPYALIVKAWNAYVLEKPMQALVWRGDEEIPKVIGYNPKHHD